MWRAICGAIEAKLPASASRNGLFTAVLAQESLRNNRLGSTTYRGPGADPVSVIATKLRGQGYE